MKILIQHNVLWTHYKSVLFEALEKHKGADTEVHVMQIAKNDISRKGMEDVFFSYKYNYTLLFDDYFQNIPSWKKTWKILKFINSYKPDVINIGGWGLDPALSISLVYSWFLGCKIVVSSESTGKDKKRNWLKESVKKLFVKMCDGFIVFGSRSRDYLLDLGANHSQILEEKAAIVDDVALLKSFESFSEKTILQEITTVHNFIFVGRLIPLKNVDLILKAFQTIKMKFPDWGLIIVGNGTEEDTLKAIANKDPKRVHFYDSVDWKTVPKFYAKSDCLVLASNSETWGLVVNEAMVCGLTAIVSDQCGCVDDIAAPYGLVIKTNSQSALENAMEKIAGDELLRQHLREKVKGFGRLYNVDTVAARIMAAYKRL